MSIIGSRINDRLVRSFKAIDNTLKTPAILDGVTPYGYGPDHMQVGLALYQSAFEAVNANTVASGAQARASERVQTTFKVAVDAYQALARIARAIYRKNPERLVTLGLNGPMPRRHNDFVMAALKLFENAHLKVELGNRGYAAAKVDAERTKIEAFQQALNEHTLAKGAGERATEHQTAALEAMSDWTREYLHIARVALRKDAKLLEKIGLQVRSGKTAAQRQAPKKAAATRAAKKAAQDLEPEPAMA
jgi:hypothetical protein